MRICLIGDFSGTPDEGMKNISTTVKKIFETNHDVFSLNSREVLELYAIVRLKRFDPEIVHYLHGPTIRSLVMLKGLKTILGKKTKIVISATRPYFSNFSGKFIPLLKPDLILTQSQKFENFFQSKGCDVQFLPNGVNCDQFFPASEEIKSSIRTKMGLPLENKIILHVGHIKQNRQLSVFKKIQEINTVQVVIVGGTAQKSDEILKSELESTGIRVIHEYIQDISLIYKSSDIYIFPIQDTGCHLPVYYNQVGAIDLPLSVLEAMASNLPVITTRFGALPRLFEPGNGFFYAETETEIIDAVKSISNTDNRNTREKVLPYDWKKIVSQIESEYRKLVN